MIKNILADINTGRSLGVNDSPLGKKELAIATDASAHGVFISTGRTTAGTTVICSPVGDGSIVLTDLIATAEKKAGTLLLEFSDGTNKVALVRFYLTDAPIAFSIPFRGRWQGWKSAYLEMITSIDGNVSVAVGYYKVGKKNSLDYNEWSTSR